MTLQLFMKFKFVCKLTRGAYTWAFASSTSLNAHEAKLRWGSVLPIVSSKLAVRGMAWVQMRWYASLACNWLLYARVTSINYGNRSIVHISVMKGAPAMLQGNW